MDKKLFWSIVVAGMAIKIGWLGYTLCYSLGFPVFLSDSRGHMIAQTFANVTGGLAPSGSLQFESPVFFSKPDTRRGTLLFANVGPEGLPDNLDDLKEVLKIG